MEILSKQLDIPEILDHILSPADSVEIEGYTVKVVSVRLTTFATKGVDCITCDTKGKFFRIEDNTSGAHLNLYGISSSGEEVLMTRDHIIPKSLGGANKVDNMNTMCVKCNHKRGNADLDDFTKNPESCKPAKMPSMKNTLNQFIKKNGKDHPLIQALSAGKLNKQWKRDDLVAEAEKLGEEEFIKIAKELSRRTTATISKLRKYIMRTHKIPSPNVKP